MASETVIDMLEVAKNVNQTDANLNDVVDARNCCDDETPTSSVLSVQIESNTNETKQTRGTLNRKQPCKSGGGGGSLSSANNYASNKNVAEGLMDIALLSANANQLRFLITYNHEATTYFFSLGLVILSLVLQVVVGIALIFKRRLKRCNGNRRYTRANEFLIVGVFMVTVVNILLAAFTTTDAP